MMKIEEAKRKLEKALTPKRFVHSINVMNTAYELAKKYNIDEEKATAAGLLHDCARDIKGSEIFSLCSKYGIEIDEIQRAQPELLHSHLGARLAKKEYGIEDQCILDAIRWHTTGRDSMSMLEKIILISDYAEPGRSFTGVKEIRDLVLRDLDRAILQALDGTIRYVLSKGALIHPDTINARNFIIFART